MVPSENSGKSSSKVKKKANLVQKISAIDKDCGKPNTSELNTLATMFNSGRLEESRQLAINLTQLFPRDGFGWKVLGATLQQQGLLNEACDALKKAAEYLPKDCEVQYNLGNYYYDQSQLIEAACCYKKALKANPNFIQAHYNLGSVLKDQGTFFEAEVSYKKALKLNPNSAEMHFNLALMLYEQGRFSDATIHYRQGLEIRPDFVAGHVSLGVCLKALGQLHEAVLSYKNAIKINPDNTDAYNNLGVVQKELGDIVKAEDYYRTAISIDPESVVAYNNLGILLKDTGRTHEAESCYTRALQISQLNSVTHNNLAILLRQLGRFVDSEVCCRNAIKITPNYVDGHNNLGLALSGQSRFDEAVSAFEQALQYDSNNISVLSNFSVTLNTLGQLTRSEECLKKALLLSPNFINAYTNLSINYVAQGRVEEAVNLCIKILQIHPDNFEAQSNLLFSMNYSNTYNQEACLEKARQYGALVATKIEAPFTSWQHDVNANRLRVGLVSGDLCQHVVAHFLENFLQHVDPSCIELIAYPTTQQEDEMTERLKPYFSSWKSLVGHTDQAAAKLIHEDGLHILLDLSGHSAGNRLPIFSWKPAPLQASWLGYFATTGLLAMDYVIADEVGVPLANQCQFVERIKYLPETRLCFTAPDADVAVSLLPAITNKFITFGCFQNMAKVGDEVLDLWTEVLTALPSARLRWQCKAFNDVSIAKDLKQRFSRRDIDSNRIDLVGSLKRDAYLEAHHQVDMILDTFPFNGGTTTCEALWMGVPTLTLIGNTLISRQGASILTAAGLPDWVAKNKEDFVSKVLAFCGDLDQLAQLRAGQRDQVLGSPLFDGPRFSRNMENLLWGMWSESKAIHFALDYKQLEIPLNRGNVTVSNDATSYQNEKSERELNLQQATNEVLAIALDYQNSGQIEQAENLYKEILNVQPNHAEANYHLGVIEAASKGAQVAIVRLGLAVESKPEIEQYWVTYIDALMQARHFDSAADALELGVQYGLKPETAIILGKEFAKQIELEKYTCQSRDDNQQFFIKPQGVSKFKNEGAIKFIIVSPYYTTKSAGVVVLHELCDSLNKLGHSAAMLLTGTGKYTISSDARYYGPNLQWYSLKDNDEANDFVRDGIVIYPEMITGNPLGGKRVVRYLLNSEGAVKGNGMEASEEDFILAFVDKYHKAPHACLAKFSFNPIFNNDNSIDTLDRPIDLTYIGKGASYNQCFVIPNTLEITREWPRTKPELAMLFKNTRFFYSWDVSSQTITDALFCGAIPVLMSPLPFKSFDEQSSIPYPMATCTIVGDGVVVNVPDDFDETLIKFKLNYMEQVNSFEVRLLDVVREMIQYFSN
jgi:predicted O-linked N-acetylglucosamine transferase (SPINDLY family)